LLASGAGGDVLAAAAVDEHFTKTPSEELVLFVD
jgi:hypothetical protein